jgi:hypothetical protein
MIETVVVTLCRFLQTRLLECHRSTRLPGVSRFPACLLRPVLDMFAVLHQIDYRLVTWGESCN